MFWSLSLSSRVWSVSGEPSSSLLPSYRPALDASHQDLVGHEKCGEADHDSEDEHAHQVPFFDVVNDISGTDHKNETSRDQTE